MSLWNNGTSSERQHDSIHLEQLNGYRSRLLVTRLPQNPLDRQCTTSEMPQLLVDGNQLDEQRGEVKELTALFSTGTRLSDVDSFASMYGSNMQSICAPGADDIRWSTSPR